MGRQTIAWYTLTDDFEFDFGVAAWRGTNASIRDGDQIPRLAGGGGGVAMIAAVESSNRPTHAQIDAVGGRP